MLSGRLSTVAAAAVGLVLTAAAMTVWAPDAASRWPDGARVLERAPGDAERLGCRVAGEPGLFVSAGNRFYPTSGEIVAVTEQEPDPRRRRRLFAEVPPVRVAARYFEVEDAVGNRGSLTLEYDGDGRWIAAEFTAHTRLAQDAAGEVFAVSLAEMLLGADAGRPETHPAVIGSERFYRPAVAGDVAVPVVYVYLGEDGTWIANRQSAPARLIGDQRLNPLHWHPVAQTQVYVLVFTGLLALVLLFWRLSRRRAGFGRAWVLLALLLAGLVPTIEHYYSIELRLFAAVGLYLVVTQGVLLLVWTVGEAELREARPRAVEHWDRVLYWKPLAATGRALAAGVAWGCLLAGLLAASGEIASLLGGGYGNFLAILPDYWSLPTPVNWGIALAAMTVLPGAFGARLWGRTGALIGAAVSSAAWAQAIPVAPAAAAMAIGLLVAGVAAWVMWRFGLLAVTVACVTGFSLPTAWVAWSAAPRMLPTAVLSSLPLALLAAALVLVRRAPEHGDPRAAAPEWVSELERQAKLRAEVDLLRTLQLSLLPPEVPCAVAGVDVAWRMIPADTVGGDFLDLIRDEDGRLWLAIADVAGHGIACSTMTAFTKAAVTEHATAGASPGDAVARIRSLFGRLHAGGEPGRPGRGERLLVTLLMATWDPAHRELAVASAGHPPLLVHEGGAVREVGLPGHPLGVALAGGEREERLVCRGDTVIVAYTDGVVEATSPSGEAFTYDRWPARLPALADRSAAEVLAALLEEVAEHCGGASAGDDVTAVVVKV
jgi:serine phosphatase RsbU (regulator of sigma subunit)